MDAETVYEGPRDDYDEVVRLGRLAFRGPSLPALAELLKGCEDDDRLQPYAAWLRANIWDRQLSDASTRVTNTSDVHSGTTTTSLDPSDAAPPTTEDVLSALLGRFTLRDFYERTVIPGPDGDSHAQGSDAWLRSRAARLSGSTAAGCAGLAYPEGKLAPDGTHMRVMPKMVTDVLRERIYPRTKKGLALEWGKMNEPVAQAVAEEVMREHVLRLAGTRAVQQLTFSYPGGIPIRGLPWFLASVDGLAHVDYADGTREVILIELKCPIGAKFYESVYSTRIPPAYFCQIQCYMGFLRLHSMALYGSIRRCLFLQWTKNAVSAAVYAYDDVFFRSQLMVRLESYYFDHVLPRLAMKEAGLLFGGALSVPRMSSGARSRSRRASTRSDDTDSPAAKRERAGSESDLQLSAILSGF